MVGYAYLMESKIIHYDLFAGIGGFSLALDTVFYDKEIKHIFCEWEAFPTTVLKKHWPDGTYYGDIADLVADTNSQRWERERREDEGRLRQSSGEVQDEKQSMVILTGGFPCQPFSHAGRRQGTSDDRYKWPDMFAVIRNVRPDWVIAENVRGLVTWNDGMVLETVCADLESEGYEVQPFIIPACAVGAPHRRDRVWIVAHAKNINGRGELRNIFGEDAKKSEPQEQHEDKSGELSDASINASDSRQQLRKQRSSKRMEANTTIGATCSKANQREHQYTWADDWREVAFATCHDGVDDGLPRKMGGVTISGAKHRKESLKAYGNAIVPQVAMEIFNAIRNV